MSVTELKDGLGNQFSLRTKDVSPSQNNSIRQNWHLQSKFPIEHSSGGAFQSTIKSNTMAAGLVSNAPIMSFRFVSASLIALIRHFEFSMWTVAGGTFAAGLGTFEAYVARLYSSEDTAGLLAALSGNVGKLRTSHQTTNSHFRVSDTTTLTAGSRTLDAHPFKSFIVDIPATAPPHLLFNNQRMFEERDHPLVLANQEGIILQASVPATGTWAFNATVVWDEVEANNY